MNKGSSIIDMSTIQINQTGYPDASRTVESYNASLGYSADLNAFLAEARLQSKDNWNPQLTADAVNDYIKEGFDVFDASPIPQSPTPVEDHAPIITSHGGTATATISIAEDAAAVTTLKAMDADSHRPIYSILGGPAGSLFIVNATTGALAFLKAPSYERPSDAGADNKYEVMVQASDAAFTDTQALSVKVTNVSPELDNKFNSNNNHVWRGCDGNDAPIGNGDNPASMLKGMVGSVSPGDGRDSSAPHGDPVEIHTAFNRDLIAAPNSGGEATFPAKVTPNGFAKAVIVLHDTHADNLLREQIFHFNASDFKVTHDAFSAEDVHGMQELAQLIPLNHE